MPAYEMPEVRIGQPGIVWLPTGQISDRPCPAMVTDLMPGKTMEMTAFVPGGNSARCCRGIRYHRDPWHKEYPQNSMNVGAWAFFDDLPLPKMIGARKSGFDVLAMPMGSMPLDAPASKTDDELEEAVIEAFHEGGMNAVEIAEYVGFGMTHQRVNGILKRKKLVKDGQSVSQQ